MCTQGCAPKAVRACSQALVAELGLVKQAVKVPLVEVLALVKEVHEGVSTVNQELALCPVADLEDDLASEAASRASEEVEAALLSLSLSLGLSLTLSLSLSLALTLTLSLSLSLSLTPTPTLTLTQDEAELMSRRFRRAPAWPPGPCLAVCAARAPTRRSASLPGLLFRPER